MFSAHAAFSAANIVAIAGWLGLLVALFVSTALPIARTVATVIIPGLLAAAYVILFAEGWGTMRGGGFGSVEQIQIRVMFASDALLVAGWLHYLAFDLFVGAWIVHESAQLRVAPIVIVPCLLLTSLTGPAGLLLFLMVRMVTPQLTEAVP